MAISAAELRKRLDALLASEAEDGNEWPLPSPRWWSVELAKWYKAVQRLHAAPAILENIRGLAESYQSEIVTLARRAHLETGTDLVGKWININRDFQKRYAKTRKAPKGVGRRGPTARPSDNRLLRFLQGWLQRELKAAASRVENDRKAGKDIGPTLTQSSECIREGFISTLSDWLDAAVPEFVPRPRLGTNQGPGEFEDPDHFGKTEAGGVVAVESEERTIISLLSDMGIEWSSSAYWQSESRVEQCVVPMLILLIPAVVGCPDERWKALDALRNRFPALAEGLANAGKQSRFRVAAAGVLAQTFADASIHRLRRMMPITQPNAKVKPKPGDRSGTNAKASPRTQPPAKPKANSKVQPATRRKPRT